MAAEGFEQSQVCGLLFLTGDNESLAVKTSAGTIVGHFMIQFDFEFA